MSTTSPLHGRVGIWVRVSTADQAQGESPEHHRIRAEQYAAINGWSIVETYDLAGVSGKSVWDHHECQRMLRDVKRGHVKGLIFSKLARLARNTRELLDLADYFQLHGAHLVSLEERFDTSTPAGRLFFTFVGAIAHWEREEIASRVKASISVRAKLGKPLGGRAPFGFRREGSSLVLLPEEAEAKKLAFDLFLEHRRKEVVARLLNDRGYRLRSGGKFSGMAVGRILECTSASGSYRINQWKALPGGKREVKPQEEWGTVPCPRIVSDETFRRVSELLEVRTKPERRPAKKPVHAFAGILRCGCGSRMYVYTRSPNYTCNRCKNKLGIAAAEEVFVGAVEDELADAGRIAEHVRKASERVAETEARLAGTRKRAEQARAEMRKVYELYIAGGVTVERFKEINGPLEARLAELTAEIPRLEMEAAAVEVGGLSASAIAHEARGLAALWPTLSPEDKQRMASLMCSEITVPTNPEAPITVTLTTAAPAALPGSAAPVLPVTRPSGGSGPAEARLAFPEAALPEEPEEPPNSRLNCAPNLDVLLADGFALEIVVEDGLDFREGIQPCGELAAGDVLFELPVEFVLNRTRQFGNLSRPGHGGGER